MTLRALLSRWFKRPAAGSRARAEAIIYFDGPLTKWNRSRHDSKFEEHHGIRFPRAKMPRPDEREIVDRKEFRAARAAQSWALWRLKGFDTSKLVAEVRPL